MLLLLFLLLLSLLLVLLVMLVMVLLFLFLPLLSRIRFGLSARSLPAPVIALCRTLEAGLAEALAAAGW